MLLLYDTVDCHSVTKGIVSYVPIIRYYIYIIKIKNPTFLSENDKIPCTYILHDYASREKNMKGHITISGGEADRSRVNESGRGGKVTKEKNKENSEFKYPKIYV